VPRSARHAMRKRVGAPNCPLDLIGEKGIHGNGRLAHESVFSQQQASPLANFFSAAEEKIRSTAPDVVRLVPNVQRHARFGCDNVARSRYCFDLPNGRYQSRSFLADSLHFHNPFGCPGERIMSKIHRCGARVVGLADEPNLQARLSNDGLDNPKRLAKCFQDRPLLDMELQVGQNIILYCGIGNFRRIQSKVFNGGPNGNSLQVPDLQEFSIQSANQSAAANERNAKAHSFFLGKADNLDSKGELSSFKAFQQSDAQDDAENSVVGSSVWDGIKVRSDEKSRRSRVRAGIEAPQISCVVYRDSCSYRCQPARDFRMAITRRGRKKRSPEPVRILTEASQPLAPRNRFARESYRVD